MEEHQRSLSEPIVQPQLNDATESEGVNQDPPSCSQQQAGHYDDDHTTGTQGVTDATNTNAPINSYCSQQAGTGSTQSRPNTTSTATTDDMLDNWSDELTADDYGYSFAMNT